MFADRKSHSPEVAPSGVRHDMFVAFMTCFRYSRGSLYLEVNESKKMAMRERGNSRHGIVNVDTVFPFELSPHTAELHQEEVSKWIAETWDENRKNYLSLVTIRRLDIIHNIDVNIVQYYARLRHVGTFP